jgi:hypothetical protein
MKGWFFEAMFGNDIIVEISESISAKSSCVVMVGIYQAPLMIKYILETRT